MIFRTFKARYTALPVGCARPSNGVGCATGYEVRKAKRPILKNEDCSFTLIGRCGEVLAAYIGYGEASRWHAVAWRELLTSQTLCVWVCGVGSGWKAAVNLGKEDATQRLTE